MLLSVVFASGGGLGSVARHFLSRVVRTDFPFSTLIVNVLGSFLLGLIMSMMMTNEWPLGEYGTKLALGFCGGFTTFSSFAYQTLHLHSQRSQLQSAANILLNLVLCLIAFWLGSVLFV